MTPTERREVPACARNAGTAYMDHAETPRAKAVARERNVGSTWYRRRKQVREMEARPMWVVSARKASRQIQNPIFRCTPSLP